MFVFFVYSGFCLVLVGLWISWAKTQTLPNLRLPISSADSDLIMLCLNAFLWNHSSQFVGEHDGREQRRFGYGGRQPHRAHHRRSEKAAHETISQRTPLQVRITNVAILLPGIVQIQVLQFSDCCTADFGPRWSLNQLYNDQKIDKLKRIWPIPVLPKDVLPSACLIACKVSTKLNQTGTFDGGFDSLHFGDRNPEENGDEDTDGKGKRKWG